MNFIEHVAIKLQTEPPATIAAKAMKSFTTAMAEHDPDGRFTDFSRQLTLWIAAMTESGLTPPTRARYAEKLCSLHALYDPTHPREPLRAIVRELKAPGAKATTESTESTESAGTLPIVPMVPIGAYPKQPSWQPSTQHPTPAARLQAMIPMLLNDARTRPAIALFLHLLLNASPDIEHAIMLTIDRYTADESTRQLDEILRPDMFHHRRRYLFSLGQSRKRMPQLLSEVCRDITAHLAMRGIPYDIPFTGQSILAMWIDIARSHGVTIPQVKAIAGRLPNRYSYLFPVESAPLTATEISAIKQRVAEGIAPTRPWWYALKLRPHTSLDPLDTTLAREQPHLHASLTLYYPTRDVAHRQGHRIVHTPEPVLPGIVFFSTLPCNVSPIDSLLRHNNLGWVYRTVNAPGADYSIIDPGSMQAFQKAVGLLTADVKVALTDRPPLGIGQEAIITGGIMEGYRGTIYNIKEGTDTRIIYLRLSLQDYIKIETTIEEAYVDPIAT